MPFKVLHVPTDETRLTVKVLFSAGYTEEDIAARIGLKSPKTLRKHYAHEIKTGKGFLGEIAIKTLVRAATKRDGGMPAVTAAIWLTKNNLGWTDRVQRSGEGDTNVHIAEGSKVVILPSNGREQIAQQRLASRQPVLIEAQPIETNDD